MSEWTMWTQSKRVSMEHVVAALLLLMLLGGASPRAHAQNSPYCLKVNAQAHADAALLFAPRLHLQVLRNPSTFDVGPTLANEHIQIRVGASWAPLDVWQGVRLLDASAADCSLNEVDRAGERAAQFSPEALLVSAYRAQVDALAGSRAEREQIEQRAADRLRDNVITVLEFHDFQRIANSLSARHAEVLGIVQRLQAEGIESPPANLAELAQQHVNKSRTLAEKETAVRAFEPWKFRLSGGVIPSSEEHAVDWYGWVDLSYSLGGPWFGSFERRYRQARAEETRSARYELAPRLEILRKQVDARLSQATSELTLNERQLEFIGTTLRALAASDHANVAHIRDGLVLERALAESERAFLLVLVETLSPLGSQGHVSRN